MTYTIDHRLAALEQRVRALELDSNGSSDPAAVSEDDIRAAYRIFLNRDPDAGGLAHFYERAREGQFDHNDLARAMVDNEEYRTKQARSIITVDVAGVKVAVDPDEPEFGRAIYNDGTWEPHIVDAIRSNLASGDVFVDIGANVGIMSFQAALAVGPSGRVLAFEPNPDKCSTISPGPCSERL